MLARRICTIVSDKKLLNTRLEELYTTLQQRGYPISLIRTGIDLALKIPLSELRNPTPKNTSDPIAYVSTFNVNNPEIFQEIQRNLPQLNNNERLHKLLNTSKIIKSKRQPKSVFGCFQKFNSWQNVDNFGQPHSI